MRIFLPLSILAADPFQASIAAGTIEFDDVTASSSAVFDLNPALQQRLVPVFRTAPAERVDAELRYAFVAPLLRDAAL